jgi:LPS export ABC transporter protein LptC
MIKIIQSFMLLISFFTLGYAGYNYFSTYEASTKNINLRLTKEGVDVHIEKFKVVHEKSGHKDWELKADFAQINKKKETTKMQNIEYVYINENQKKFKVYADSGTLTNKTNDLDLEGNVRMLIERAIMKENLGGNTIQKIGTKK